jgi:protease-4
LAFVKAAWRILVGVKDLLVLLLMLLFFGLLYAALTYSPKPSASVSRGALLLDLKGVVVEQPREAAPISLLSGTGPDIREFRLRDIITALDAAKDDGKVKAVVLNLDGFMGGGQVSMTQIGAALDAVRAKKPVLAYATTYADDGYQLAAHASEIWLNPFGEVFLAGPGGSQLFYKGLMDRLGVNAHVYRVGTYKSFVEPYVRTDQSPDAKKADQALVDALWQDWREDVAKVRPKARLDAYISDPVKAVKDARGDVPKAAVAAGLIDKVGDEIAFGKHVAEIAGKAADDMPGGYATLKLSRYVKAHQPSNNGQIGVVTIAGDIVDGDAGPGVAAGDTISDLIYTALAEKDLKALVVRVDSPGGSVLASEKIRSAILEARGRGMPIVVSMANVAASGGYWVTTPADRIFAEPATITGSIGVFGILPSFEGALAKIGVTTDGVKTTPLSGEPDILGGISPQFDAVAQSGIEAVYGRFVELVAKARRKTPEQVDTIAQGRVWDGGTAHQNGLIDRFGGVGDAIAEAARLAKIDPAKAKAYYIEKDPDFFTRFFDNVLNDEDGETSGRNAAVPRDWLSRQSFLQRQWAIQAVQDARSMIEGSAIRASCLECASFGPPRIASSAEQKSLWALLAAHLW